MTAEKRNIYDVHRKGSRLKTQETYTYKNERTDL